MFMQRFNVFFAGLGGAAFAVIRPRTYDPFGDQTDLVYGALPALVLCAHAALGVDGDFRNGAALMTLFMMAYFGTRDYLTAEDMPSSFIPTTMGGS